MSVEEIPSWIVALFTVLGSAVGAWTAVKVSVTKLEVNVGNLLSSISKHESRIATHNDDLLVHDMELESVLGKLQIPRARRQRVREQE